MLFCFCINGADITIYADITEGCPGTKVEPQEQECIPVAASSEVSVCWQLPSCHQQVCIANSSAPTHCNALAQLKLISCLTRCCELVRLQRYVCYLRLQGKVANAAIHSCPWHSTKPNCSSQVKGACSGLRNGDCMIRNACLQQKVGDQIAKSAYVINLSTRSPCITVHLGIFTIVSFGSTVHV